MNAEVEEGLLRYFAIREQQRADAINRAIHTLRPYERRLVREAAVMGYVRGAMAGRARVGLGKPREDDIPVDGLIIADVLGACIAADDLYPYLAAASEGRRRRVTASRRWLGEDLAPTAEGDKSNGGSNA